MLWFIPEANIMFKSSILQLKKNDQFWYQTNNTKNIDIKCTLKNV